MWQLSNLDKKAFFCGLLLGPNILAMLCGGSLLILCLSSSQAMLLESMVPSQLTSYTNPSLRHLLHHVPYMTQLALPSFSLLLHLRYYNLWTNIPLLFLEIKTSSMKGENCPGHVLRCPSASMENYFQNPRIPASPDVQVLYIRCLRICTQTTYSLLHSLKFLQNTQNVDAMKIVVLFREQRQGKTHSIQMQFFIYLFNYPFIC